MIINQEKWDPDKNLKEMKKRSEEAAIKMKQEQEEMKQKILFEWKQCNSITFWTQCFLYVPLKIIRQIFSNVNELNETGYEVNNKAALFVSILKKMGYFPWKGVEDVQKKTA